MPRRDPFMAEHLSVFQALAAGDVAAADTMLKTHLEKSCLKVTQRAELVRRTFPRPDVSYIG